MSLLPFWRTGSQGLWEAYDQAFPLNPVHKLISSLFVWNEFGTGFPMGIIGSVSIPFQAFDAAVYLATGSALVTQRLVLVLNFALTGWGMYYLLRRTSYLRERIDRLSALCASVLYMFNLFIAYWMFIGSYPEYPISVLPFSVAFLVQGLEASSTGKRSARHAILFALTTLLLSAAPEFMVIAILLFLSIVIGSVGAELSHRNFFVALKKIRFVLVVAGLTVAVDAYWLFPLAFSTITHGYLGSAISASPGVPRILSFFNEPLVMIQSFRMNPWVQPLGTQITALNYWTLDPRWMYLGLALMVLGSVSLLLRSKERVVIASAAAFTLSLGLASGVFPFGAIYLWLYGHLLLFSILSDPHKFLVLTLFSGSIMMGLLVAEVQSRLSRRKLARPIALAILVAVLLNSSPLLNGNMNGQLEPVQIPDYYQDLGHWLSQKGDNYRVLALPVNPPGFSPQYTWAPYPIAGTVYWATGALDVPVIGYSGFNASLQIGDLMTLGVKNLGVVLSLWNIRYAIVENDSINSATGGSIPVTGLLRSLESATDMVNVGSFGQLSVFENQAWQDTSVYGATSYIVVPDQSWVASLESLADQGHNLNATVLISKSQAGTLASSLRDLNNDSLQTHFVALEYQKINPTQYSVSVATARPFILVLNQYFDSGWSASITGSGGHLSHFMVNSYANGWLVNRTGHFEISVGYDVQPYLVLGIAISSVSLAVLGIVLVFDYTGAIAKMSQLSEVSRRENP